MLANCIGRLQTYSGCIRVLPSVTLTQERNKRWYPQRMLNCALCTTASESKSTDSGTSSSNSSASQSSSITVKSVDSTSEKQINMPTKFDWKNAAPIFAKLPENKPHFATVKGDSGVILANQQLYVAAIEKSEVLPAKYETLSGTERDIYIAHLKAVQKRQLSYKDPITGYTVMTACQLLLNGDCCGNGCRHCPYEWQNVKDKKPIHNGGYFVT